MSARAASSRGDSGIRSWGSGGIAGTSRAFHAVSTIGTVALAVILVEGGLSTRWGNVRPVLAPAAVLATAGVGLSAR